MSTEKQQKKEQDAPANTLRGTFYVEGNDVRHELEAPAKSAVIEQAKPAPKATPIAEKAPSIQKTKA